MSVFFRSFLHPFWTRLVQSLRREWSADFFHILVTSSNFFDNFNYFDDTDPTNGWVQYVDAQTASQGVSSKTSFPKIEQVLTSYKRTSRMRALLLLYSVLILLIPMLCKVASLFESLLRILGTMVSSSLTLSIVHTGVVSYSHSSHSHLLIDKFLATWPALWLSDVPNWPSHGEIDVMEQVNTGTDGNIMSKSLLI